MTPIRLTLSAAAALSTPAIGGPHPELILTRDDTPVDRSCRVVIPDGTIIQDDEGDGVLHVTADGVTVEFADGAALLGGGSEGRWNELTGVGVRVENASNVTLRNLRVHAYRIGVLAANADGLTVESADLSDNYRQRLASTPLAEDASDWLFPHRNDERQWLTRHGAALAVERSDGVTIRGVRVRRGQNGIILDRVTDSRIYDNDASFLSGWGLALWRSSDNVISRNAFDFCVRGHSEGVYNRGQDSAGILFFEQCNRNIVVENSATHSGDGFFGFAGREAIGETPEPDAPGWSYRDAGCNDNVFVGNDFSYAPAHGWEMTFSEGNVLWGNRLVGNAICGVWGGYSSETIIAKNEFRANGGMPYGDENGGVNIEHGSRNVIYDNDFINNTVAVRLWWDDDGRVLELPGIPGRAPVNGNIIADNHVAVNAGHPFDGPRHDGRVLRGFWFRGPTGEHFSGNIVAGNTLIAEGAPFEAEEYAPGTEPLTAPTDVHAEPPEITPLGESRPVGARRHLAGRENIVMGEWGPWDHASPMVRLRERGPGRRVYDVFGVPGPIAADAASPGTDLLVRTVEDEPGPDHRRVEISNDAPGVHPFEVDLAASGRTRTLSGTFVNAEWDVRVWSWTADPLGNPEAWRGEGEGEGVVRLELDALDLRFRSRSPAEAGMISPEAAADAGIGPDRFGVIATTSIPLAAGRWRIRTVSDDGIRVTADGETIIERWNIHGPTPDEAVLELGAPREVGLRVEYFEMSGWAALSVDIEPAGENSTP